MSHDANAQLAANETKVVYQIDDLATHRGSAWRGLRVSRNKPSGLTAPFMLSIWQRCRRCWQARAVLSSERIMRRLQSHKTSIRRSIADLSDNPAIRQLYCLECC
jgi:hypothetical protein